MARIETSLEANYQRSWGISEGVRDLIANAKDAEIEHGPTGKGQMVVWHKGDTLYVRTKGVTLDRDVLLMGVSSKMDRSDTIGQFGEGLVMSFLAIAREEGYGVVVTNGGERWTPAIEPSTGYKGREVLVINTRKLQKARRSYTAAISGIDKDEWEALREQFLFLDPDYKEAQSVKPSECYHRILLQSKFKGRIFVKGVMVSTREELKFGYDLDMPINRDRHMMEEWNLRWKLAEVLQGAVKLQPKKFVKYVKDIMTDGSSPEAAGLASNAAYGGMATAKVLAKDFDAEHGEGAIPVDNAADAREVEEDGGKPVIVSKPFREMLEAAKGPRSVQQAKEKFTVTATVQWNDLSKAEKAVLEQTADLLTGTATCKVRGFDVLANTKVVTFQSPKVLGTFCKVTSEIRLARRTLASVKDCIQTAAHEAAHAIEINHGSAHHGVETHMLAEVIEALLLK